MQITEITEDSTTIGWDIGGAHIKAALIQNNVVSQVAQVACPLWRGLSELVSAVQEILNHWALVDTQVSHAITMTGELVDLFPNRQAGVIQIAETMQGQLNGTCWYYQCVTSKPAFVSFDQLTNCWEGIASANWHASTTLIAQQLTSGLFVDIGSTTTDIIVMHNQQLLNEGHTDASRMRTGELLYTGIVRTPLMALGSSIDWYGQAQPLAAEYFATTADVYRMTGQLLSEVDMSDTADGGDKSMTATATRLARMIGHDVDDDTMDEWQLLAQAFKAKQMTMLALAVKKQLDRLLSIVPSLDSVPIVTAGIGSFLIKEVIAERLQNGHYPQMDVIQSTSLLSQMLAKSNLVLGDSVQDWAGHCLPAVAVALLLKQFEAV